MNFISNEWAERAHIFSIKPYYHTQTLDSRYRCMNYEKRIPWRKQLDPKNYILIGIYVLF